LANWAHSNDELPLCLDKVPFLSLLLRTSATYADDRGKITG